MGDYCGGHLGGPPRGSREDQKSVRSEFVLCYLVSVAVSGTRVDVRENVHGPHRLTPASSIFLHSR